MSDLLSRLRPNVADTYDLDQMRGTEAWNAALDNVREALLSRIEELRDEPHTDWFLMGWNAALNRIECWATDAVAGGDRRALGGDDGPA